MRNRWLQYYSQRLQHLSEIDSNQQGSSCTRQHHQSTRYNGFPRLLYTTAKYTFFSSSHGTFAKMGHIINHKIHLCKFRSIEIIQYLLLNHNGIKLEITNRKITEKNPKIHGD